MVMMVMVMMVMVMMCDSSVHNNNKSLPTPAGSLTAPAGTPPSLPPLPPFYRRVVLQTPK